jgi:uncharacterized OB-fold protein
MSEFFEAPYKYTLEYAYSYGGISRFFAELRDNARFVASHCPGCGKTLVPPVADCAGCRRETEWVPVPSTATVVSATYCYHLPAGHPLHQKVDIPYILGIVQLDETDSWLMALIVEEDMILNNVKRGDRVEAVFRAEREGKVTDFYFVPIEQSK